jgi:hypothetical protein
MYEKYGSALPVSWILFRNQISSANAALDPDQGKPHHADPCGSGTLVWIHAYSNCVFYDFISQTMCGYRIWIRIQNHLCIPPLNYAKQENYKI